METVEPVNQYWFFWYWGFCVLIVVWRWASDRRKKTSEMASDRKFLAKAGKKIIQES
jgi:hypothetical protein